VPCGCVGRICSAGWSSSPRRLVSSEEWGRCLWGDPLCRGASAWAWSWADLVVHRVRRIAHRLWCLSGGVLWRCVLCLPSMPCILSLGPPCVVLPVSPAEDGCWSLINVKSEFLNAGIAPAVPTLAVCLVRFCSLRALSRLTRIFAWSGCSWSALDARELVLW
jgi:hypothetical protein